MMRHNDKICLTCKVVSKYDFEKEEYDPKICTTDQTNICPNYRIFKTKENALKRMSEAKATSKEVENKK